MAKLMLGELEVGELHCDERPGKVFEIRLDVEPEYQRRGIGRALVEAIEVHAKEAGGKGLYTFMAGDNGVALGFFRRLGFKLTEAEDFYGTGRHAWFGWRPIKE